MSASPRMARIAGTTAVPHPAARPAVTSRRIRPCSTTCRWSTPTCSRSRRARRHRLGRPLPAGTSRTARRPTSRGRSWSCRRWSATCCPSTSASYAGEAFISTAQAPSSLVRHAHRLAYQPDPGLAASGYVVLSRRRASAGRSPPACRWPACRSADQGAGLRDPRRPRRRRRAQRARAARRHEAGAAGRRPPTGSASRASATGSKPGDPVALVGPHWQGFVVEEATELPDEDATLGRSSTASVGYDSCRGCGCHPGDAARASGTDAAAVRRRRRRRRSIRPRRSATPRADRRCQARRRSRATGTRSRPLPAVRLRSRRTSTSSQEVASRSPAQYVLRSAGADLAVLQVTQRSSPP